MATDLQIPRQMLVLPNGDVLVAEGRGGGAPALRPKDVIAGVIKKKGNTQVESGNRIPCCATPTTMVAPRCRASS